MEDIVKNEIAEKEETKLEDRENKAKKDDELFWRIGELGTDIFLFVGLMLYACQPLLILLSSATGFPISTDNVFLYSSLFCFMGSMFKIIFCACAYFPIKGFGKKNILNFLKSKWELLALCGAFLWCYISSTVALRQEIVWEGNWYNKEGFKAVCKYATIFLAGLLLKSKRLKRFFCIALVFSASVMGICLLYSNIFGVSFKYHFTRSVYKNSNHYGYALSISTVMAVALCLEERSKLIKSLYFVSFAILHANMLMSDCLGSFLGETIGLVALFSFSFLIKNKKELFVQLMIALLIFVGVTVALEATGVVSVVGEAGEVAGDVSNIVQGDATGNEGTTRWSLWTKTIDVIAKVPLFGKGLDCYYSNNYIDSSLDMPHNEYIQIASNVGLPALLLYLSAIIGLYVRAILRRKEIEPEQTVCLASALAYLVSALFGNTFPYTYPFLLILLAFGVFKGKKEEKNEA